MLQTSWHGWLCDDVHVAFVIAGVFFIIILVSPEHTHAHTLIWVFFLN